MTLFLQEYRRRAQKVRNATKKIPRVPALDRDHRDQQGPKLPRIVWQSACKLKGPFRTMLFTDLGIELVPNRFESLGQIMAEEWTPGIRRD